MRTMPSPCGERGVSRELVQALPQRLMCQECGPLRQVRANVPSMFLGQGVTWSAPDDDLRCNALRRQRNHVRNSTDVGVMRLEIST